MIKFDKKDITALDFIIDKCIENDFKSVTYVDLVKVGFLIKEKGYSSLLDIDEKKEFERLMFIIRQYDCAKTRFTSEKEAELISTVSSNIKTSQFKSQGGFKKAYKDLKKPLNWYLISSIILSLILVAQTIYYQEKNYDLKVNQPDVTNENDSLKSDNVQILKVVDSLLIENELKSDKIMEYKRKLVETKID